MTDALQELLPLIVCPQDRQSLHYVAGEVFYNPRLRLAYPIEDGIAVLLRSASIAIDREELHSRYMAAPLTNTV